ncbi:MAG: hypothetical protein R3E58_12120 [Phycisphaerae bacterium]
MLLSELLVVQTLPPTYDDNGNLTFDGNFKYTYDAWNRLVKATLDDTDVTIHEAAFDGLGRRVVKTVSNSGDLDGVTAYYHNRNQIVSRRGTAAETWRRRCTGRNTSTRSSNHRRRRARLRPQDAN